jgi:hypothetical protein
VRSIHTLMKTARMAEERSIILSISVETDCSVMPRRLPIFLLVMPADANRIRIVTRMGRNPPCGVRCALRIEPAPALAGCAQAMKLMSPQKAHNRRYGKPLTVDFIIWTQSYWRFGTCLCEGGFEIAVFFGVLKLTYDSGAL